MQEAEQRGGTLTYKGAFDSRAFYGRFVSAISLTYSSHWPDICEISSRALHASTDASSSSNTVSDELAKLDALQETEMYLVRGCR
jgi:hypothetical protein